MEPQASSAGIARVPRVLSTWLKRYRSINWAVADQAMVSGINFLTGILLARYLGVVEFGVFTLAWLIVEFIQGMQYSLVITPMLSIGPKQPELERPAYFGSVIVQQAGFAVLSSTAFLACILGANHLFPDWNLGQLAWPLTVAVLVSQFQNFARRYFFTFGRSAMAFLVDLVRYAGQIGVLFWLLLVIEMDAGRTLWVISGSAAASTLLAACFFERFSWDRDNFRLTANRHWDFSKWLALSELMRWATGNFFMFVAGGMIGAAAVGALRAAQNLVGLSHIMMLGLENVVPVGAARRLSRSGMAEFLRYLKRTTILGSCSVAAVVVTASVAPEFWLGLVYGDEYVGHGNLVRWWSAVYFVAFLSLQVNIGLRTIERTKSVFWAHLATAVFSVASVYPLIAYLDVVGVVLGSLLIVLIRISLFSYSFFGRLRSEKPAD